jgi:lambda family phage portal protein
MGVMQWMQGLFKPAKRDNFAATYGSGNAAGFAGGGVNRLTSSLATWSGAVNADLDGSLVILRARARQLAQSNEYGRRFLTLCATNIVGRAGPKLQVRAYKDQRDPNKPTVLDKSANDAVEIHWDKWGKTADITGKASFSHLVRMAVKAVARDGEALVRIVRRRELSYGLALQLLEADRLDESINIATGSRIIRQGVEIDTTGRPVAYYIKTHHPGDRQAGASATSIERVPANDIVHLFLPERAEQVRGYTWFHAILLRAAQLHGFNEAAVTAARIGASKIVALERSEESADLTASMADGAQGPALQMNVEAGEMFELPPGYKLSSWNPEYPHSNFDSFVKTAMRGISSGLDVATHNLSGDMTDVNYSSARIAELAEREVWMVLQDWLIFTLVEPIYQEWIAIALLRGDITFEVSGKSLPADKLAKFANASRFQGRRWRWVDPSKEINAFKEAVDLGITSRTRIAAEQGDDFEDVLDELAQEEVLIDAAGIRPEPVAVVAPVAAPEKPAEDLAKMFTQMAADFRAEMRSYAPEPAAAPSFTIHNHLPPAAETRQTEQPAPVIHINNQIQEREQAAPVVNVTVEANMPEQPAPQVEVNVVADMPTEMRMAITEMPDRVTTSQVVRDSSGNIKTTTQTEQDA